MNLFSTWIASQQFFPSIFPSLKHYANSGVLTSSVWVVMAWRDVDVVKQSAVNIDKSVDVL